MQDAKALAEELQRELCDYMRNNRDPGDGHVNHDLQIAMRWVCDRLATLGLMATKDLSEKDQEYFGRTNKLRKHVEHQREMLQEIARDSRLMEIWDYLHCKRYLRGMEDALAIVEGKK